MSQTTGDSVTTDGLGYCHVPKLHTAADLAALPSELPSGPVLYELQDGVLITMSPPGGEHGSTESRLDRALGVQGEDQGFGRVFVGEVGIVLWRNPDRVVGADLAFVAAANLPVRFSDEGYLQTIPDLVVEVVSKNDTRAYLGRKVADYLRAGVRIVWIVDPATRKLTEHHPDTAPTEYDSSAVVELPELIPGFRLALADVFRP